MHRSWFFIFVFALITCVSAWIIFTGKPEAVSLRSDDGLLAISGTSRNAKALYIVSNTIDALTIYRVLPESLARQASLEIAYAGDRQLFLMDPDREAWRPADSTMLSQGHTVFAVGESVEIDLADYTAWFNESLAHAPESAISYEQFVTYQIEDELSAYLAPSEVRQASCETVFYRSKHIEERHEIKEVRMPVNGIMRLVRLTLTTKWFINKGTSNCLFISQE